MSRVPRIFLAAAAVLSLCLSAAASAQQRFYDPPGRVARISDMRGELSYSPAGDGEWYDAHRNRPLLRGDALWSDRGARAELQAGSTWIRMDGETSLEFLELDDRMLQLQVTEGTISVRIRRLYPGQRVEVDTPNLALVLDRPGTFRIDVDREGDNTTIEAREGFGMVYGTRGRFPVRRGDVIVFYGEDIRDYEMYAYPSQDNFDRYVRMRDQRIDRSLALRYLGDDLVGFSDLDDYGRWSRYPGYGNVWFPTNVYSGWAPYQDGEWIWQEPWGWTWVDDEPWGFAPSHYGRWAWVDNRWGWVPGSRTSRSVYAPALVAFIEDVAGSIGWFPLGPGDIYYPTYSVSSRYFNSVNVANTSVATGNLGNAYQRYGRASTMPMPQAQAQPQAGTSASGGYRNRNAPRGLTIVPKDVFTSSRPVREAVQSGRERELLGRGEMRRSLSLRPAAAAIRADAPRARVRPPRAVEEQQVFVRNAPPAQQATPAPSAPAEAPAAVRERPRRVRMITEQAAAADVRATTKPQAAEAAAPAAAGAPAGQLRALDREALPRARGGRRMREQQQEQTAPAPTAPAASAPAPAGPPRDEAREAEEARVAAQKAREEQRQAREAQRSAQEQAQQAERAAREAQVQRDQAKAEAEASAQAQQQREAVEAEAKARVERDQAQAAAREAQRQQREAQQAAQTAQREQAQAQQAQQAATAAQDSGAAEAKGPRQRRECVTQERIDAMRKRGVSEERIAELKVCPVEEPEPAQQ